MGTAINLTDKIDPKADISIIRKDTLTLKDKVITGANSLRTHAKVGKGHWILVHDGRIVKSKQYMEKGTVYTKGTIFCGTDEEVDEEIKRLRLRGVDEKVIDPIINPVIR